MENTYLLVYWLLPIEILYKSNRTKRSGKNSIMLHFHWVRQLSVLDRGAFMWALSPHTRERTVASSLKKADTETTVPQKDSGVLFFSHWVLRSFVPWWQCTPESVHTALQRTAFQKPAFLLAALIVFGAGYANRGDVFRVRPHRQTRNRSKDTWCFSDLRDDYSHIFVWDT